MIEWTVAERITINSLYRCQYLSTPTTQYGGADLHLERVHSSSGF